MLALLLAVLLPALDWDQGPSTANAVQEAGVQRLYVPADEVAVWKNRGFDALWTLASWLLLERCWRF